MKQNPDKIAPDQDCPSLQIPPTPPTPTPTPTTTIRIPLYCAISCISSNLVINVHNVQIEQFIKTGPLSRAHHGDSRHVCTGAMLINSVGKILFKFASQCKFHPTLIADFHIDQVVPYCQASGGLWMTGERCTTTV